MAAVSPYIHFDGNCEAAFNFYKTVFQSEFTALSHFDEAPEDSCVIDGPANRVMHVALPIGDGTVLLGSDSPDQEHEFKAGNNFSIVIRPFNEEEAHRLFNELSAGGRIVMSLEKTFWGALYGSFIDKFGISWMINFDLPK
ncbi:VOC family protein [Chitinophaga silvatica]|uniref:VOC family protein n=1 Tax=Chitinophaga silvatica TaxID=2282649 RepID=A0A3E1Y3W5_9BACT|nr:VOC family protein [Chitinophaga silvatica]RFS19368.1 VOC family protein [Chitinophaga silvatica]